MSNAASMARGFANPSNCINQPPAGDSTVHTCAHQQELIEWPQVAKKEWSREERSPQTKRLKVL